MSFLSQYTYLPIYIPEGIPTLKKVKIMHTYTSSTMTGEFGRSAVVVNQVESIKPKAGI